MTGIEGEGCRKWMSEALRQEFQKTKLFSKIPNLG